jgi:hypothetical protein
MLPPGADDHVDDHHGVATLVATPANRASSSYL